MSSVSFTGIGVKPIKIEKNDFGTKKTYPDGIYSDKINNPFAKKVFYVNALFSSTMDLQKHLPNYTVEYRLMLTKFEKDVPTKPPEEGNQLYKVFQYESLKTIPDDFSELTQDVKSTLVHNVEPELPRKGDIFISIVAHLFNDKDKMFISYPVPYKDDIARFFRRIGREFNDKESFKNLSFSFFKELRNKTSFIQTVYSYFTNRPKMTIEEIEKLAQDSFTQMRKSKELLVRSLFKMHKSPEINLPKDLIPKIVKFALKLK